ncbi:MAG: hypothetical protein WC822_01430 [Candidatus Paceibacterota bacterium]|jgi:hypothetical protein
MKQDELILLMMRGLVAGLPAEQQKKVTECIEKIRSLVKEYGDDGVIACQLVGAELLADTKEVREHGKQ